MPAMSHLRNNRLNLLASIFLTTINLTFLKRCFTIFLIEKLGDGKTQVVRNSFCNNRGR